MKEETSSDKTSIDTDSQKRFIERFIGFLAKYRTITLLAIIVLYIVVFGMLFPDTFPTFYNVAAVLLSMSLDTIVVVAMALLLISGEIDLSLGGNMALSGVICGYLIKSTQLGIPVAILLTLGIAVLMGWLNGFIVARIGVNSFITTLATGMIFTGLAVKFAGSGITDLPDKFIALGQGNLFNLQLPVWYGLVIVIIFSYLMSKTKAFRQYYYIGCNAKASLLSGIRVKRLKMVSFIVAGILAGLVGIASAARYGMALTVIGNGVELKAITAAVIGGVSFTGGVGSMFGAALGSLFMALLYNGLIIANVNQYWMEITVGLVMVFAVISDILLSKKRI